jgi:hypothetical protein
MSHFERWCQLMGVQRLPASPSDIALFIGHTGLSPSLLQQELAAIDDAHAELGYAEPCKGRVVSDALHKLHSQPPPRSWPKEEHHFFRALPWSVQTIIARREAERDKATSKSQSELAEQRKRLERTEKELRNDNSKAA